MEKRSVRTFDQYTYKTVFAEVKLGKILVFAGDRTIPEKIMFFIGRPSNENRTTVMRYFKVGDY